MDRALQKGGIAEVKVIPFRQEELPCIGCFNQTTFREVHISPSGKEILLVP
jgi:hypothetical protein